MEKRTTTDYRLLFESGPSLFLVLAPDAPVYTILDVNKAYLSATLTKKEEITDRGIFEVFPDNPSDPKADGVSNLRSSLGRVLATNKPDIMPEQKYDIPLPKEEGGGFKEKFWKPCNSPVHNEQGEIIYIIHTVEDVTDAVQQLHRLSEDARQVEKDLEKKSIIIQENDERIAVILKAMLRYTTMDFSEKLSVSEKGDELDAISAGLNSLIEELEHYTRLLLKANADLEYANAELDSFSYSVSHDLRAPLRAISGYSLLLLEDHADTMDENAKNSVGVVVRNAAKMGKLIDDLLTFSRLGKQNLMTVMLDMSQLAENAIREFNGQATFRVGEIDQARGDGSMIQQVWMNLISNAVKYSRETESPLIEIGSYTEKDKVIYFIKDNGIGFSMAYYDKLFGVFQRLHSPSKYEGSGVGLALVERIIRKHHGEVWAEAVENEGATFYFSLPSI